MAIFYQSAHPLGPNAENHKPVILFGRDILLPNRDKPDPCFLSMESGGSISVVPGRWCEDHHGYGAGQNRRLGLKMASISTYSDQGGGDCNVVVRSFYQ